MQVRTNRSYKIYTRESFMKNRGVDKTPAIRAPGLLAQWICVFSRRQNQVVNPTEVTVVESIKRHPFQAAARSLLL